MEIRSHDSVAPVVMGEVGFSATFSVGFICFCFFMIMNLNVLIASPWGELTRPMAPIWTGVINKRCLGTGATASAWLRPTLRCLRAPVPPSRRLACLRREKLRLSRRGNTPASVWFSPTAKLNAVSEEMTARPCLPLSYPRYLPGCSQQRGLPGPAAGGVRARFRRARPHRERCGRADRAFKNAGQRLSHGSRLHACPVKCCHC